MDIYPKPSLEKFTSDNFVTWVNQNGFSRVEIEYVRAFGMRPFVSRLVTAQKVDPGTVASIQGQD